MVNFIVPDDGSMIINTQSISKIAYKRHEDEKFLIYCILDGDYIDLGYTRGRENAVSTIYEIAESDCVIYEF